MIDGFLEQRKYIQRLHQEAIYYNRLNTAFLVAPNVKGGKVRPKKLYPLPFDDLFKEEVSIEKRKKVFDKMHSIITNGKLRGYQDKNNAFWNKDKTKIIGHVKDGAIQYIN